MVGRPIKHTPDLVKTKKEAIIGILKTGGTYRFALETVQISSRIVAEWRQADLTFEQAVQSLLAARTRIASGVQGRLPTRVIDDVDEKEKLDVIDQICNAIRGGLPVEYCCLLVNISRGCLKQMMLEDANVAARVNKAQAQNLLWWISRLRDGATRDWRAALAYLERVFPHMFAECKAVDVSVRTEEKQESTVIDVSKEAVLLDLMKLSDDELLKIVESGGSPL